MKSDKIKMTVLALFSLLIGVVIGLMINANASTITGGYASSVIKAPTNYEIYAMNEIKQYITDNDLKLNSVLVYRESTQGKEIPGKINAYDLESKNFILSPDQLIIIDNFGEISLRKLPGNCDIIYIPTEDGNFAYHINKGVAIPVLHKTNN